VVTPADISADFQGKSAQLPNRPARQASAATGGVLRKDAWKAIARIGLQAADALRHAHRQSTLHRDIKPANLLIDTRGGVWVADFGLAVTPEESTNARRGGMAGTPRYMAPEQFEGLFDERSDLYSLGLTLYELCTLTPAFDGKDRQQLVERILAGRPATPRKVNPQVPRGLERIIVKAIQPRPADRYQSADELIAALKDYLSGRDSFWRRWIGK
jgi:serine/threonine protein kinase